MWANDRPETPGDEGVLKFGKGWTWSGIEHLVQSQLKNLTHQTADKVGDALN